MSVVTWLPEDQLRTAVRLICAACAGVQTRGGEKKRGKNNTENRKTGQDADICKRSDTDLEKASSSGWLVNRGMKLPCGSQSMGKSPAHWLNLYISVANVYCSLKPGDYWNIFFPFILLSLHIFCSGGVNPQGFGVMKTEHNFQSVSGLLNSIPGSPGESQVLLLLLCSVPLLSAKAGSHCGIIQNCKPFCYVNVLHSLNLRCTFV